MEEEQERLHEPTLIRRILAVAFVASLALWANHEASKGYEITVVNDAAHTPAGRRFALLFVSDDKASRIVIHASRTVERILYAEDGDPAHKKPIDRVTLRLVDGNLTKEDAVVAVDHRTCAREFVVRISSNVMNTRPEEPAVAAAVHRCMARVWLWDGGGRAPAELVDGMVEYVSMAAGFAGPASDSGGGAAEPGEGCWAGMSPAGVARLLMYGEAVSPRFVARLNGAMREGWHVRMVDDAFGRPICESYSSLIALPPAHASAASSGSKAVGGLSSF
ncbi:hypothetical protein ACLOJK_036006 [Asimina triloba]